MNRMEVSQFIKFDEWRWKVSYGMPVHGLDIWSKRAQERENAAKEAAKRERRGARFSWRRHRSKTPDQRSVKSK